MAESSSATGGLANSPRTNPWLVFLLPMVVYSVANMFEPAPPGAEVAEAAVNMYRHYPAIYAVKIALTIMAISFVWPGYKQLMPVRASWLAVVVGVVGVVLWVGLWRLDLESHLGIRRLIGGMGQRSAFNPFDNLDSPAKAWAFMAVRLFGLTLVVPLIEEMFLRGFVTRFAIEQKWMDVPFGKLTPIAVAAAIAVPVLMHPAELFAATAWFGLMVGMYAKTKNIWDCVVAHITTNGLLGLYVLTSANPAAWQLL